MAGDVISASGRIEVTEVNVSSKVTGRITTLDVDEGTDVKQGQLLATLEGEELEAQLRQVRATLQSAEAKLAQARITLRVEPITVQSQIRQAEEALRCRRGTGAAPPGRSPHPGDRGGPGEPQAGGSTRGNRATHARPLPRAPGRRRRLQAGLRPNRHGPPGGRGRRPRHPGASRHARGREPRSKTSGRPGRSATAPPPPWRPLAPVQRPWISGSKRSGSPRPPCARPRPTSSAWRPR